jgi:hypothetical protein
MVSVMYSQGWLPEQETNRYPEHDLAKSFPSLWDPEICLPHNGGFFFSRVDLAMELVVGQRDLAGVHLPPGVVLSAWLAGLKCVVY